MPIIVYQYWPDPTSGPMVRAYPIPGTRGDSPPYVWYEIMQINPAWANHVDPNWTANGFDDRGWISPPVYSPGGLPFNSSLMLALTPLGQIGPPKDPVTNLVVGAQGMWPEELPLPPPAPTTVTVYNDITFSGTQGTVGNVVTADLSGVVPSYNQDLAALNNPSITLDWHGQYSVGSISGIPSSGNSFAGWLEYSVDGGSTWHIFTGLAPADSTVDGFSTGPGLPALADSTMFRTVFDFTTIPGDPRVCTVHNLTLTFTTFPVDETNKESALFRVYVDLPAGNLIGLRVDPWYGPANNQMVTSFYPNPSDSSIFLGGQPNVSLQSTLLSGTEAALNGQPLTLGETAGGLNIAQAFPGLPNVFAFWANRPIAYDMADFLDKPSPDYWALMIRFSADNMFAFHIAASYSVPVSEPPPDEGLSFVGRWDLANPLANYSGNQLLKHCPPRQVGLAIGWGSDDASGPLSTYYYDSSDYFNPAVTVYPQISASVPLPGSTVGTVLDAPVMSLGWFRMNDIAEPRSETCAMIAQGFNAQWETIPNVVVGVRAILGYPPDWDFTLWLCNDLNGVPDTTNPITSSTVFIGDVPPPNNGYGRIQFDFGSQTITLGQNYWLVFSATGTPTKMGIAERLAGATDPVIEVAASGWFGNARSQPGVNPVVYGHASQGYQALLAPTWDLVWKQVAMRPSDPNEQFDPLYDQACVWIMEIGGEGIAITSTYGMVSSPPNGMGTAGRRDPNIDLLPHAALMMGWSADGPAIDYSRLTPPLPFIPNADTKIGGTYLDPYGATWAVCWAVGRITNPLAPGQITWGYCIASRALANVIWTWPWRTEQLFDPTRVTINGMWAVGDTGVTKISLWWGTTSDPGVLGRSSVDGVSTWDFVFIQCLFPDGSYSSPHVVFPDSSVSTSIVPVAIINDASGNTHVVVSDRDPDGTGNSNWTTPANLYHCIVSSDGTVGPLATWGTTSPVPRVGTVDAGVCQHPASGGVYLAYWDQNARAQGAIFYPDGSGPVVEKLPDWRGAQPWLSAEGNPDGRTGGFLEPLAPVFDGLTGYLFLEDYIFGMDGDTSGLSVAKYDLTTLADGSSGYAWSGLTYVSYGPYSDSEPQGVDVSNWGVVAGILGAAPAVTPVAPPPPQPVHTLNAKAGCNVDPTTSAGSADLTTLQSLGGQWIRLASRPGSESYAQKARALGFKVLAVIVRQSTISGQFWSPSETPYLLNNADMYEVGNEPDGSGGSSWPLTPDEYVVLWNQVARLTSAPRIIAGLVAGPDASANWLSEVVGRVSGATSFAFHPYGQTPSGAIDYFNALKAVARGLGGRATEWNTAAADIAAMVAALNSVCEAEMFFCWSDGMVAGLGLVTATQVKKAEFTSYQQAIG